MKENQSKNRITYFDYLKVISIVLVIYVHVPWISESKGSNLTMLITIIAVPFFFMVNGALLFSKTLDIKKHYIKVIKLVLSVIVWKLIILIIWNALGKINSEELKIGNILTYLLFEKRIGNVPVEHLWFIYSLIRIYILYPFIRLMIEKNSKYMKYILAIVMFFSFGIELLNWSCNLFTNQTFFNKFGISSNTYLPLQDLTYISYFIIGWVIHSKVYSKTINNKKLYLVPVLCFVIGLVGLLFVRYKQVGTVLDGKHMRIVNDYSKISDLLMATSIFALFAMMPIKENKVISFLGQRTLRVYFIHMLCLRVIYYELYPTFANDTGAKLNFVRTIIVYAVITVCLELLRKIKPVKKILNI